MSFIVKLQRAREIIEQQGRLSTRALERELGISGTELEELIEELVDVQGVARREGRILVRCGPAQRAGQSSAGGSSPSASPRAGDPTASRLHRANDVEVRKVVTIVFADLIGSTALHERLDPESVSRVMERYHAAVRAPVEAHGGTVVQLLGDGVMCAFGVPKAAEDDAIRAVRAAVAIVDAVRELAVTLPGKASPVGTPTANGPTTRNLSVRVAVNTGEVVVSDDYTAGIGDPLNVAARLQQEARDGDVLIGESTQRLVRGLVTLALFGVLSLKGRSESVTAYRVVSLERPAGALATAFVGRDDELRRIAAVYDTAVGAPAARLVVVLGSPGLGKSRLVDEFTRHLEPATVLTAHCDAAGGATFAPVAKALRSFLHIGDTGGGEDLRATIAAAMAGDDPDGERIAAGIAALLSGTPAPPEETFFVVRRFLGALAAAQPLVLAIDDLQWAEPLLLDLIEHLVQWSTGVPLLLLAAARPELRDVRSSLVAAGKLVADVVVLGGLDAIAASRLAANVIGTGALPAAVAGRILARSEGNPLFLGELVRMLVDDGALKREGDRWTAAVDLAALEMPPTIHALLAARIERLRPEDRLALERAAIVGRQFSRAALAHLLPNEITDLDARLEALKRSELIEPDTGWFLGEPALRFHHGLTRDAAYRRVLKGTRAELHESCAEWIEGKTGDTVEHDETIGWHLEQAHQHLRELGTLDARGQAVGERAARYLAAAGRRALARDDLPVAANLLGRALDQLDAADPKRADLALDWCEALLAAGDVGPAAKAIDELGRFVEDKGLGGYGVKGLGEQASSPLSPNLLRLRAWHTCFAGQLAVFTNPQALHDTASAVAVAAEELAAVGDTAGEAKAHLVHALALSRLGKVGACEAELDKALVGARRADDRRRANTVLANAPLAALWGPSPVARASGRCLDVVRVLRITQGAPAVEAVALRCQAVLEALRGRSKAARRMIASARHMVEELGVTQQLLEVDTFAGLIELLEGDDAAAVRGLRVAYDGLREHGLRIDAARAAAFLGRALLLQGGAEEAEAVSRESEALAGDDLQAAITWRGVRAEALASRGEHAAAVDIARAAVDLAVATDALLLHADARLALAAALRAAGHRDEAATEEARAIELWEAKGATVLAERVRSAKGDEAPFDELRVSGKASVTPGMESARAESVEARGGVHEAAVARRVQANAATAHAARVRATTAARDADALPALVADGGEVVYHPTHSVYDMQETLRTWRSLMKAPGGTLMLEPLAALGDSLALCRQSMSATAAAGEKFDVGPYEVELFALVEVDELGRRRRSEFFALDRLGDAIVRLYERYAELLPAGTLRTRAVATARTVAAYVGPFDFGRYAAAFAADVEAVDHRTLGTWTARGAAALLQHFRSFLALVDDATIRADEILALCADALLVRWTNHGSDRAGGGNYERPFLLIQVYGADGLTSRAEWFDPDRVEEALARFDVLTAGPTLVRPVHPRVQPNAAVANVRRFEAALAARDTDVFQQLLAEDVVMVEHPTGAEFDRSQLLRVGHGFLTAEDLHVVYEPLATLGDALALCRQSLSAGGVTRGRFDIGAYEREELVLVEVDATGRWRRMETFAIRSLGNAIARLYERYAELLAEVPERARAAATARSVAALLREPPDRWPFAPDVEATDSRTVGFGSLRGADAVARAIRGLMELTETSTWRCDDVLALRSDALLVRWTQCGTDRASGGEFERRVCHLWIFGPDGLATRWEQFDAEQDAAALARLRELVLSPVEGLNGEGALPSEKPVPSRAEKGGQEGFGYGPSGQIPLNSLARLSSGQALSQGEARSQRRVQANAATANAARADAAIAVRDVDAFLATWAEGAEVIDHPIGAAYGLQELGDTWRRALLRAPDLEYRREEMATLGDTLALFRHWIRASAAAGGRFDVGNYEIGQVFLNEVDEEGRWRRSERFAVDRLGDAVVRLYERYAELLPDGSERARAAATARSVASMQGPWNLDRQPVFAPTVEVVDHRILGSWSARGAKATMDHVHSVLALADNVASRVDDVLGLRAGALLWRTTHSGTARAGGGAYERQHLMLIAFATDGLVARQEYFDADRDAEALARFDVLKAEPPERFVPARSRTSEKRRRRVQPNAATENAAGHDAAFAGRDAAALAAVYAEDLEVLEYPTGAVYDRDVALRSLRSLLRARDPAYRHEPLATLGDGLALCRVSWSASGVAGGKFDVGAYEVERINLVEVDAQGRRRRAASFAVDRLGDAVARLYERYAELLPEGPEKERAATTARSVVTCLQPLEIESRRAILAPDIAFADRRTLGMGSLRGAEAYLRGAQALIDVAVDRATRVDEILALRPNALLVRWTTAGIGRASGGAFEKEVIQLWVFGTDGLLTRAEQFDADADDQAVARFDKLVPSPAEGPTTEPLVLSRPRASPNAATAIAARMVAAFDARDADALVALSDQGLRLIHHPTGTSWEREGFLASSAAFFAAQAGAFRLEPLATLGDSLALCGQSASASGIRGQKFDVGAYEIEEIALIEADARGQYHRGENFAADRLGDAVARLYERHAELLPEGPESARAAATARSVAAMAGPLDLDRWAGALAPGVESVDHRVLGTWSAHGADEMLRHLRSLLDLSDDVAARIDDILALQPSASLVRRTVFGTERASGGAYERPYTVLEVFGGDGLLSRMELFDADREEEALARFDELVLSPVGGFAAVPPARFENAATRAADRIRDAMEARDWERFAALFPAGFRSIDRQRMALLEADRDWYLEAWRPVFEAFSSSSSLAVDLLATRGDRLALGRARWTGGGHSVGPSELEWLGILEVDRNGDVAAEITFDPDDLDVAYAEIDARFDAGEAAPFVATWKAQEQLLRAPARDWEKQAASLAPDFVVEDHSPLGWGTLDRAAYLESVKALAALAPDARVRTDHLWLCDRGALGVHVVLGTHEGGAFEQPRVTVSELDAQGRERRRDVYTLDQLDEARARFAAVSARRAAVARDPLAALAKPNAATAAWDRAEAALAECDWAALRALCAADATFEDRRRDVLVSYGVEEWIADRQRWARSAVRQERRLVITAGDGVALERILTSSAPSGGRTELGYLSLREVDECGRIVATVAFDLDDRRAAHAELVARTLAADAAAATLQPIYEFFLAHSDHDLARVRAAFADDVVVHDHRLARLGIVEGSGAYLESLAALWRLAPDDHIDVSFELARARYGLVSAGRSVGTLADGGTYEIPAVIVWIVAGGRITRLEFFELEDVGAALARFAELRRSAPSVRRTGPDPLRIPPNAASRAFERRLEVSEAGDWEALEALCAPALVHEDRRRLFRTSFDRERFIAHCKWIAAGRPRVTRTVLATAGDSLALLRLCWTAPADAPLAEIEQLTVWEVDTEGRLTAIIVFDPADRRAAGAEMLERFARSDAARCLPAAAFEAYRAINDHDLERIRATLHDDFVFDDRRRTGVGQLEGADDYVASLRPLFEGASDFYADNVYDIATDEHGWLTIGRTSGILAEGGEFESVYVRLLICRGDRIAGIEQFELEDLDRARERFEQLGPAR